VPTFDIVSQVDLQEVRNAVDQSMREIVSRYDFKGTDTTVSLGDGEISVESASDHRTEAAIDVLKTRLVGRGVSLKALGGGAIKPAAGGRAKAEFVLNQGISQDAARELSKEIRALGLKVQVQVQGDQLRVQGKKRDDLQAVIVELKGLDYRLPLQYVNYRD
jgi:cyclic-di-GMP-binding protein